MIHVILADDDILALNRLTDLIDWNANGYEIIGRALGGHDCLTLLEQLKPDILILDIDMPDKNGVEVIKEIQQRQYPVKVLILSNYDTFSFVRSTLYYGACDYLLKHQLNATVLLTKLRELSQLIEKDERSASQLSYFTTIAKQNYLNNLIRFNRISSDEHAHMMTQKDFSAANHCLAVMQISNFILITHFSQHMERKKVIESILSLSTNILKTLDNGLITHLEFGQFAVLFYYDKQASTSKLLEQTQQIMQLITANIHKLLGLSAIYQISDIFTDMSSLGRIYQQTQNLLEKQTFPDSEKMQREWKMDMQEEKALLNALTGLDGARLKELLDILFEKYSYASGQLSQLFIEQLLQIGIRFQQNQQINLNNITDSDLSKINLFNMTPEETCQLLTDYFIKLLKLAPGYGSRRYSIHIQKALQFIHENYAQDISLQLLAETLHISPTHLSRLFSKEVGSSFIDYLVNYRIVRARLLIQNTNMDLKSIAEQVGFHSYNYFLRTYKEKTGHTPSQDMLEQ